MNQWCRLMVVMLFATACDNKQQSVSTEKAPATINTVGKEAFADTLKAPKVVPYDPSKFKNVVAGEPSSFPTNTNVFRVLPPIKLEGETSRLNTIPLTELAAPTILAIRDSAFLAGVPEIIVAKDAHTKDQNPQNFSSFNKLQGLKHGNVRCLMEDDFGNIWLGTEGGGVSKYDGKSFTHYTENEGLSGNDVRCMIQDRGGNIWFGTSTGGITKFNGKYFTRYTMDKGFPNNDILSMEEDLDGNIWFGTNGGGLLKYDSKLNRDDSCYFELYLDQQGIPDNIVWSLMTDKQGNIWIGTERGGLVCRTSTHHTYFDTLFGLPSNHVISLMEESNGSIWLGTEGKGVSNISFHETGWYEIFTFDNSHGLPENVVRSIVEDQNGNIWFGTIDGGVCKYVRSDEKGDGNDYFIHFTMAEGLTNQAISSVLEDQSGNIWLATYGGGISRYNGKLFTHFTTKEGLSANSVWSMTEDREGNLWFGTGGFGISMYDGFSFSHYTTREGLCSDDIRSMTEDEEGNLWFGSVGSGVSRFVPANDESGTPAIISHFSASNGLSGNDVRSIIQDHNGDIWFAVSEAGITRFNGKEFMHISTEQGLSSNNARCIMEDYEGNIWVATSDGGLTKIEPHPVNDSLPFTCKHFTEAEGLANNFVLCILQDENHDLWIGTYGGGINKLSPKEDGSYDIVTLTEEQGLANNFVFSILEDQQKNIWFGTRFGLSKLTPEKGKLLREKLNDGQISQSEVFFKNYTYEDGFLGIGCNGKAICQSKDGIIWIGTNDRLTAYHPEPGSEKPDTLAPNIQLTGISLFNEKIAWTSFENKKDTSFTLGNGVEVGNFEFSGTTTWYGLPEDLTLDYTNNYLSFSFIGITMNQPRNVKYQYKLEGLDENWSAITDRTEAPYGNLPHGKYTFKVKAMNSSGYWSDEYHYTFTIRPPWWHTWWFRITALVVCALILYGVYRWRTAAMRNRQKILEKTVTERTGELIVQKKLLEVKHKEITDSINYAERIQRSFLASKSLLNRNLKEHFVFFQPKDVVSGDFYWATELRNGNFALVTADSTGHGVPGAIMSILNITCLEKAVDEQKLIDPAEILNHVRSSIIDRLSKDGSNEGGKDGMDASIICFDVVRKRLNYAAANNPVWIVRNKEVIVCEPESMPVARHDKQHIPFTSKSVELQTGDVVYTLTDGFADQFGGPKGKKYMYKKLKNFLASISHLSMNEQREKVQTEFSVWKGALEQVDDVCLLGVRI